MARSSSYQMKKLINEKLGWKIEKSKDPDPCSYDVSRSIPLIKPRII